MEEVKIITFLLIFISLFTSCSNKSSSVSFSTISECEYYIKDTESTIVNIVPETEKKILFAHNSKKQTDIAIVYIHGFSASRQEISPVTENLAKELGANIFYTRLRGHGRGSEDMREVNLENLIYDTKEAIEIGTKLGKEVVLIGTSLGAPLIVASYNQYKDKVKAHIYVSPLFKLADPRAFLLRLPFGLGRLIVKGIVGPYRSFTPNNEMHKLYWTERYPSTVLVDLMNILSAADKVKKETVKEPVLILYNPDDNYISTKEIVNVYSRFPSEKKEIHTIYSSKGHDITGDINCPENTQLTTEIMFNFISQL